MYQLPWTHIMIHHSATADSQTFSWSAIRRYHMTDPAHLWKDIGYHFGVEIVGTEYEALVGRPLNQPGAHCPQDGMNHRAIGICVVGNFDLNEPTGRALVVLRDRLLIPLMEEFAIPKENVLFHRDVNPATSCPGHLFTRAVLAPYLPSGTIV